MSYVTLATDDGQNIKAHKIVLSAGSNFFADIFLRSDHSNMLIYLKGIHSARLEQVLDFIYNGEANIGQEDINEFLETGKELQVKGLDGEFTGIEETNEENPNSYQNMDNAHEDENLKKVENIGIEDFQTVAEKKERAIKLNDNDGIDTQI